MSYREFFKSVEFTKKQIDKIRNSFTDDKIKLLHWAVGLSGEAGEILEIVKKHIFQDKELNLFKFNLELGDARFYLEGLCDVTRTTIEEIEKNNIDKLTARYPKGYEFGGGIRNN